MEIPCEDIFTMVSCNPFLRNYHRLQQCDRSIANAHGYDSTTNLYSDTGKNPNNCQSSNEN